LFADNGFVNRPGQSARFQGWRREWGLPMTDPAGSPEATPVGGDSGLGRRRAKQTRSWRGIHCPGRGRIFGRRSKNPVLEPSPKIFAEKMIFPVRGMLASPGSFWRDRPKSSDAALLPGHRSDRSRSPLRSLPRALPRRNSTRSLRQRVKHIYENRDGCGF
jgi:hypothetical protein